MKAPATMEQNQTSVGENEYPSRLHEELSGRQPKEFPAGDDYVKRYDRFEEEMIKHIHPEVEKGAAATGGEFLNKHDATHVFAVMKRAADLLGTDIKELTGYEIYVLMVAIHLHDVGNTLGRSGHEQATRFAVKFLGSTLGHDQVEIGQIQAIAAAHGGTVNGSDKDTISQTLEDKTPLLHRTIRPRFLAALLRFADELADDQTRASTALLETGNLPEHAILYHLYSQSLHSVMVLQREITLDYWFTRQVAAKKYKKEEREVFLLDEIYARTVKMHFEREYCMLFLRPLVGVDRITVTIRIFDEGFVRRLKRVWYRLPENGYPSDVDVTIQTLCPKSELPTGHAICQEFSAVGKEEGDA